ncbi:hypothetical protein PPL_11682 [Heterostelium album PN500]|uniref:ATPase AAA-type core domain-containing protein n=1 Tax=Heterostelium pallidum (strain ATCC 26659 / Pp 5 / PN500) TaxID=670386 RepID=D3BU63_HETP5|nr:hypothetical protein PPL_11682 [Heterostelium album PN500]EFA75064.1 hypothetical protein PPL_11682 [Heterostelium album PN500]|eukprot:XP_020427198.1 hypothetical protein PPL_11682 [Heterostelium album PN500]
MSQQQHPPFTCWIEFSNKKDKLTFENTANYNRLIPVIRGSKQLAVGDGSIDLFSDAAKTIQLDVETPVDRNLQRIYVATTQPQQDRITKFSVNGAILPQDRNTTYFWIDTNTDELIKQIRSGLYICMYAPRSSGKSTIAYRIIELLRNDYIPIVLSFDRNYIFDTPQSFWTSFARDLTLSMKLATPIDGLDGVLYFFAKGLPQFQNKKVVLFIDEFDTIFPDQMYERNDMESPVLNSLLTQLRAWKQTLPELKVLHVSVYLNIILPPYSPNTKSVISVGTFSLLEMTTTRISPFNTPNSLELSSFTLNNVSDLFGLYSKYSGVSFPRQVISSIYSFCSGIIQTICAKNKTTFDDSDWTMLSTVGIFKEVRSYVTIRQMCVHLNSNGPFFENVRKALASCVMSYPDFVESNNENEKYFHYLTAEGFLTGTKFNSPFEDRYCIRSKFLKNITCFFSNLRSRVDGRIAIPFKTKHLEQIDVVSLIIISLQQIRKDIIIDTRSLKKNRSNGYQRDALVPSESVYHFEIYQLIAHQSNLPNIIYPEITSSSDDNADRRADMFIKYRNWSVVLELVAHQNPKGVEAHLDSALEYKNRTNADETWVLNFTCGPIDTQIKSKSGVGLIHVCHSRDYSAVNVQVHYPNQDIGKTYHDTRQYPVSCQTRINNNDFSTSVFWYIAKDESDQNIKNIQFTINSNFIRYFEEHPLTPTNFTYQTNNNVNNENYNSNKQL